MKFRCHLNKRIQSIVVSLLIFAQTTTAQASLSDSFYNQINDSIINFYRSALKGNLRLYNGSEYVYIGHNVKGFPYFESAEMLHGSVYYDGNLYTDISMYYDLVNDEVVILDFSGNYPIRLITDKVKYFIIGGYRFINPHFDSTLHLPLPANFYQELYKGKTGFYARKEKKLTLSAKGEDNDIFIQYNKYFIYKDNKVYKITSEKSVLNTFKKRKSELKKYINANKIDFKKNFEEAVVRTQKISTYTKTFPVL